LHEGALAGGGVTVFRKNWYVPIWLADGWFMYWSAGVRKVVKL
jgi:hypothetical protein